MSKSEIERRVARIVSAITSRGLEGLYLASPANIAYVTNFIFTPTERPIAAFIDSGGEVTLFVPFLEYEHALKYSYADNIVYYEEYPGEVHPMVFIGGKLREMGFEGMRVGYDVDGYGHVFGYRGPKLSDVLKASFSYERDVVESLRIVKSNVEIELMRESAKWASYAHRLLQDYVRPGALEDEVSLWASAEATIAMAKALGERYRPWGWTSGARASFRGQVGPHSYYPHSHNIHAVIKRGHVLVTGATAMVSGYGAELERTMIVGGPTQEQEKYFNMMLEARRIAMENVRPGVKCSDVDRVVRRYFKERGIWDMWRHHVGHGIGLEYHEAPFLDVGDERELKPGMTITIEPGIYVRNLGGFRHSDTILVTEDGYEKITVYPESLEDLIIEA
ncbi:MAG: Xaa-Pro peptidase family protein [Thermoprotei archaeon]|nr:Xaa-Pro peptidase family protein [Thermoprotei archaeon]